MKRAGHQREGMEAAGPIVAERRGHQEIIALPSDEMTRKALKADADLTQRTTRRLMSEREVEIELGDDVMTPAMKANKEELGET